MLLRIDPSDRRPIYRQVADEIKMLIAGGKLREGAPLPSVRQLASDLGVNLNTIATAYRELQDEGLIAVRHGSGAVVTSRTSQSSGAELRQPLRTALTELVLGGLSRREILNLVSTELNDLTKGAK
ncbi:MAG: GntR family transcriptional regulator [Acidobacteria bacterium]|nr:GntR family transcriptional regulator [Acidobacteriota bacterium]MBV9476708.1 GntR family transcriptional regulator [Acidobacteriota bacterium]